MSTENVEAIRVGVFTSYMGDAALSRRLTQLRDAGCEVTLFGFKRRGNDFNQLSGIRTVDLGISVPGHYVARSIRLLAAIVKIYKSRDELWLCERVWARNLDMALLACFAMLITRHRCHLSYEVLDIARIFERRNVVAWFARLLERNVLRRCDEVVVSSASYIHRYFKPVQHYTGPWALVENKYSPSLIAQIRRPGLDSRKVGPTLKSWTLGWFGKLRSEHDLRVLAEASNLLDGMLHVNIFGTLAVIGERKSRLVLEVAPYLHYRGVYTAKDLPAMYAGVHLTWCADNTPDKFNESISVPNRIFEAGYFAAPLIVTDSTAAADYVKRLAIGWCLERVSVQTLCMFFRGLDVDAYNAAVEGILAMPKNAFCDDGQVTRIVHGWASLGS